MKKSKLQVAIFLSILIFAMIFFQSEGYAESYNKTFEVGSDDEFQTAIDEINKEADGSNFLIKLTSDIELNPNKNWGNDPSLFFNRNTTRILGQGHTLTQNKKCGRSMIGVYKKYSSSKDKPTVILGSDDGTDILILDGTGRDENITRG